MEPEIPMKKVELHVHLDGSIRPSTAWELARKKGMRIPGISSFIEFKNACMVSKPSNLMGFLKHFDIFWPPFSGDLDAMERMAFEFCEDAFYAGVVYAEVRYSPRLAMGDALRHTGTKGLDEVIVRVSRGLERGEQVFGIQTRSILCACYSPDFNDLEETLELCRAHYHHGVVGMDLLTRQPEVGVLDEAPLVEPIISVFREAANTGVHRTVHAAEASGAESVDRAFYKLGSERIGHGYHVLEDSQLYQRCVKDQVPFECCPYSSLMTGSVKSPDNHPIIKFARDGANFSINSDDPTVTGHFVQADYELLNSWGLTGDQLSKANLNAVQSSFLNQQEKNNLLRCLMKGNDRLLSHMYQKEI